MGNHRNSTHTINSFKISAVNMLEIQEDIFIETPKRREIEKNTKIR